MSGDGTANLGIGADSVKLITEGLRGAIGELREVGGGIDSGRGVGFEELRLTGMEAGHGGLAADFESFCERWEWGVRALVVTASQLASRAGIAAGGIWEEDRYQANAYKYAVNSAIGNPHLTEEEVKDKKYGELLDFDMYAWDRSTESIDKARADIAQQWKDTARTVVSEGNGGRVLGIGADLAGADGEAVRQRVRDAIPAPPPEQGTGRRNEPSAEGEGR
ncbi:hypothetical protein [Streptomyces sp. URMC 123]|uniref:hypothetical protein n=1 Tax=Streptomyces sp. URMC 123 TaxID=3423403 RepID=UPI003F1CB926